MACGVVGAARRPWPPVLMDVAFLGVRAAVPRVRIGMLLGVRRLLPGVESTVAARRKGVAGFGMRLERCRSWEVVSIHAVWVRGRRTSERSVGSVGSSCSELLGLTRRFFLADSDMVAE